MPTPAEAHVAPKICQAQRWALRGLLRVNEAEATPDDLALHERVRAAASPDKYDIFLQMDDVIDLFRRRVLFFGAAQ